MVVLFIYYCYTVGLRGLTFHSCCMSSVFDNKVGFDLTSMIMCRRWASSRVLRPDWLPCDRVRLCVPSLSSRAGWWRTFQSVVEAFWGSWASGAVWVWVMPPWSKILIGSAVCLFFFYLVWLLDKLITSMCNYVGMCLFSSRQLC